MMKHIRIFAALVAAVLCFASCELKNELLGSSSYSDMGKLELEVSLKKPVSKAAASVETSNFPVVITGLSEGITNVRKEYASASEMPATITLPVGEYKVEAHTPGELLKNMAAPYYKGSNNMVITKNITTSAQVVCKAANSRISLKYGEDFLLTFSSWTITIDDGASSVLSYTDADKNPADVYWLFEEGKVEVVTVNVRAVTTDGNTISDRRVFRKSDATENYEDVSNFFGGGDALEINMGTVVSPTGEVTGITVNTFITFDNYEDSVEIPVYDDEEGGSEPGGGTGEDPVIELPADFSYSASTGEGKPASADAWLRTPAGLKSAIVRIETTSAEFEATLQEVDMGGNLLEGVELVNNAGIDDLFAGVGLEDRSPKPGVTEYKFPVGAFFMFLDMFPGVHKFNITLTDNNDKTVSDVLTITITE